MGTLSPSSFYELSQIKAERVNGRVDGQLPGTAAAMVGGPLHPEERPHKTDPYESTTDLGTEEDANRNVVGYTGNFAPATLPLPQTKPTARPNGILKNSASLPRDLSQLPNEITNPVFVGELYDPRFEKTVLNAQNGTANTNASNANPQLPNGTSASLQRAGDLSLKKKVSFSDNVVYTADLTSDIALTGLSSSPDEDGEDGKVEREVKVVVEDKEDQYDLIGTQGLDPDIYNQSQNDTLDSQPRTIVGPHGFALRVDEYELRNRRLWRNIPGTDEEQESSMEDLAGKRKDFRYAMSVAVILVVVALAGLVVLGTLYGIK